MTDYRICVKDIVIGHRDSLSDAIDLYLDAQIDHPDGHVYLQQQEPETMANRGYVTIRSSKTDAATRNCDQRFHPQPQAFIEVETREEAEQAAPWAVALIKAAGGWMAFDDARQAEMWERNRQEQAMTKINIPEIDQITYRIVAQVEAKDTYGYSVYDWFRGDVLDLEFDTVAAADTAARAAYKGPDIDGVAVSWTIDAIERR